MRFKFGFAPLLGVLAALAAPAPSALAYTAFVTNEKDNSVSVIDTEKMEVTKTFKVGQRPRGVILSKDAKWLIVCTSDENLIQVYDTKTYELVKTLPSGPDPELLTLAPSGNPLYVANEDDNLVTVIDINTGKVVTDIPVGVEPEGMGMSPDGKVLVNTSETTNMAHFIDTETKKTFDNVLVDARPRVAMFNSAATQLWVSSEVGGTVTVINPKDRKIIGKVNFEIPGITRQAIQPVGVRISPDDKLAFVALGPANRVAVIDTATLQVIKYLLVGQRVWQMAFTPDYKYLLTTNGASNDVSFIDVAALKVVKSVRVGRYPWGVVVAPF
ncbi:MAG TPA: PQQ-dependent catabolism-associated beta-propeller protein [Hyphomicrobium sp.]|nr:PQQ-dependent catabolism-associated beta-propeller protein [Hyphomicrobium sp.]